MKRLFTMTLLMLVSMGAWADVKVVFGENGSDSFEGTGGKIAVTQEVSGTDVTVTLIVTPDKANGYTISKSDIKVYATLSSSGTRTPTIASTLELKGDDPTDLSAERKYTVTVTSKFGIWVKEVTFIPSGKKGGDRSTGLSEGYYYIKNYKDNSHLLYPSDNKFNSSSLTPYVRTAQSGEVPNAIWEVRSAGDDDFYLIHWKTKKYIVKNGNKGESKAVHLEATSNPGDEAKFTFKPFNSAYGIVPKVFANDALTENISFNPHGGMGKDIGFYKIDGDEASRWIFTPTQVPVEIPLISQSGGNFTISCATEGATIYYTTDGTTPTTESTEYKEPFPSTDVVLVRAFAVKTNYFNSDIAERLNTEKTYLLKNNEAANVSYYMIPPFNESSAKVTTSNVPNANMKWKLEDAGNETGIQYYYIKNISNNHYVYCSVEKAKGDALQMKDALGAAGTTENRYKFKFISHDNGTFTIVSKQFTTEDETTQAISFYIESNKMSNNNANATNNIALKVDNVVNSSAGYTRWSLVECPADPKTLFDSSFSATDDCTPYYKIQNVGGNSYYLTTPAGANYTHPSTRTDLNNDSQAWYFEHASDNDEFSTYYHIRNAKTGEYFYIDSNYQLGNDNTKRYLTSTEIVSGHENQYKFIITRTANSDFIGSYNIIPKVIKDQENQVYISLNRRTSTGIVGTINDLCNWNSRMDNGSQWNLVSTTFTCEAPTISYDNANGVVIMACATPGAKIYYRGYDTEGGEDPTLTSGTEGLTLYEMPFAPEYPYYKAIAARCITDGSDQSIVTTDGPYETSFKCSTPVIIYDADTKRVTITSSTAGAIIYYILGNENSFNNTHPNYGGTPYPEGGFILETPQLVKAIAIRENDWNTVSDEVLWNEAPHYIDSASEIGNNLGLYYVANEGFVADVTVGTTDHPFTGKFDGALREIAFSDKPLFGVTDGAVIRNVILGSVSISGTNVGAIVNEAKGESRIYNCGVNGGTVSGSGYVGSIVGLLDGSSRVINCYSYAEVSGGTNVGGIVGYNNYPSTSNDLRTMVMNCMFYGNITTGTDVSPIYGGNIIRSNYLGSSDAGINNYNYYRFNSTITGGTVVYNCALAAEDRFLERFEFYRQILNSNRELAAWYATGSADNARIEMAKWVLETADLTITEPKPYPVLKPQAKYPSIINYDAEHAPETTDRNKGGKLGTLTVTISMSNGAQFSAPDGARITTSSLTLNITDKDYDHFNFNYGKIQLPYYNDVGTKNYTGGRVVTGWKITSVTGGNAGTFKEEDTDEGYNFADRECTSKDLYSVSGRVFAQGAYYDVPNGVTAISIEPYWAKTVYLSDPNYDKTYLSTYYNDNSTYFADFAAAGVRYSNNTEYPSAGSGQKVYTNLNDAINNLGRNESHTVFDYAVVLVGNYHAYMNTNAIKNDASPFTMMSIDNDGDNEPDYCFIYQHKYRINVSPIRFDFLCWPGIGMAQKANGSTRMPGIGIFMPNGWFEVTNTCLAHFYEVEYMHSGTTKGSRIPLILQGGVYEQIISSQNQGLGKTQYIHIGGNAWFKMFNNGTHADKNQSTPHIPISVTGGDFEKFYLSGMFLPGATPKTDDAECYISGGHFGEVAGAGMEQINGKVTWKIDRADISNFYGGGINAAKPITGNISVTIKNSFVDEYCGGPKFGDVVDGKTVTTNAEGCTFGTFFGAGFGGTSFNRIRKQNLTNAPNYNYSNWATSGNDGSGYKRGNSSNGGIATSFEYELFAFAGFSDNNNVGRFYVNYASLSLAATHDVSSTLTNCTVTGNFYGGGNLGQVDGNVISTLSGNTVIDGDVYGAGFSASVPTVEVMPQSRYIVEPFYNEEIGAYTIGVPPATETYTWHQVANVGTGLDDENHLIYTTVDLSHLGTVTGDVTLNITGNTTVGGSVYGGGALASSNTGATTNKTTVNLIGGTINGDVYGGGMGDASTEAKVGTTQVNLNGMTASEYKEAYSSWGLVQADGGPYTVANTAKGCVVKGSIFGCNNVNGTPLGSANVHIYKTQNADASQIGNGNSVENAKSIGHYDLIAVYGGGNLAPYMAESGSTNVIIDGCSLTSIETVYGGGNAASTPATNVTVNGSYEINELFGGGNGLTALPDGRPNPGANVGYKNYTEYVEENGVLVAKDKDDADTKEHRVDNYWYGSGAANVTIYGGNIHTVFGGSNTKGNVRISAVTLLDDANDCDFNIEEAYGGGKSAPMDAEAKLLMSCIPGLKYAYGGAEAADIQGDVTLNITNGNFQRVFGGNNKSGTIGGKITVNIEETGCRPIVIGQVYGGGNLAPYDGSPTVNVKSFTSIGEIYGGGYGSTATVNGDTYVNINEVVLSKEDTGQSTDFSKEGYVGEPIELEDGSRVMMYSRDADENGAMGVIGNVYGGGNEAQVNGSTHVNVGTASEVEIVTLPKDVDGQYQKRTVKGADIRGDVYGGGNKAVVSGNTNVTIGK